jgi:hypothetical protein
MDAADVGELDSLLANLAADGGPVGGACPQIVDKLRHTIVGLKNEGLSMILNSSLALDVADDVALLDTTRIIRGSAKELRNRRAFSDEQVGG